MNSKQIIEHFNEYENWRDEESMIINWWERYMWADMPDDVWEHVCWYMNEKYDWSNVTDDISQLITENMK
jgi:predicted methyltransferase